MNVLLAILIWGLSWVLTPTDAVSKLKDNYPDIPGIAWVRERFLLSLAGVSADAEGLVAGLTIGLRDQISEATAEQMRTLSLTHLVAVSGANLAIVLASVYYLLAAIGVNRSWRFGFGLAAMAAYVLLVGPESSVIRAATMAIFVMVGLWLGRGSSALNSLALAVILLLVIDPALSRDFGFALSAFATAGLLILAPALFDYLKPKLPEFLALGIAASASAQLFTTPVLLLIEPSLPLYAVLANVIVEPVVAPITILGILTVLIALFNIPLASSVSYLASWFSSWVVTVAAELSSWPEARLNFVPGMAGIAIVAAAIVLVSLSVGSLKRFSKPLLGATAALALFSFAWSASDRIRFETFAGDWELVSCDVGQGDATLLKSEGVVALIDVGPEGKKVDDCLKSAGIIRIDLLVLTHFDRDHVAGIQGALKDRSLGHVLVSGFEDDRPAVELVDTELKRMGVAPMLGHSGLSGTLGAATWRVLSPSANASEAVDSNDASVVIAVEFPSWSFLGLGDLGEQGQQRLIRNSMPYLQRLASKELVVKVAHHGSADQSKELGRLLGAEYALFSVGENNYGHPTGRALDIYRDSGANLLRTDQLGPIAMNFGQQTEVMVGGKLSS